MTDSPADEYERRFSEQGRRAFRKVALCYGLTLVPYIAIPFAALTPGLPEWLVATVLGTFALFAFATGAVTLRHWPVLSREKRAFGLAPWAMCVLMATPFLFKIFR